MNLLPLVPPSRSAGLFCFWLAVMAGTITGARADVTYLTGSRFVSDGGRTVSPPLAFQDWTESVVRMVSDPTIGQRLGGGGSQTSSLSSAKVQDE